jgi:intein-encoded DNA endonuclease-like protein
MTDNFKTTPLYLQLKEQLKTKYKHNFEDKHDFIYIYHKSMVFYIEPYSYNDTDPNTFEVLAGLNKVELCDGDTEAYNYEFQTPECCISTEEDVNNFMYELEFMIKTCDADKRCNKILKAVDKLQTLIDDNNYDRDFLIETLCNTFDL